MQRVWDKYLPNDLSRDINLKKGDSIYKITQESCEKFGSQAAFSCMGATLSYSQYQKLINRLASYLRKECSVKKGDRVGIMLPNIFQFPVAFMAIQKLGAICVCTNPLYTSREMKHQFCDAGINTLIIIDLFADKLQEILGETKIKNVIVTSIGDLLPKWKSAPLHLIMKIKKLVPNFSIKHHRFADAIAKGDPNDKFVQEVDFDDVAVLQYTGGTTGVSKAAMLTQGNLVAHHAQIKYAISFIVKPNETVLCILPLYHIFSLLVNQVVLSTEGHHIVLVPKPIPIENTVKMFEKYPVTLMAAVNTLLIALNNNQRFKNLSKKTLRVVVTGGMALQEVVGKKFMEITGSQILPGYGLTEASPVTHLNLPIIQFPLTAIGIPLIQTDCKIVNDNGEEVKTGEVGELCVKGPQVMKGYWNRPDETAKVLKDGWLFTGDMAKVDENGLFYIVDRKKDMILVSGFNVYPNEVEDVIVAHPKVLEVAAIGVADSNSGEAVKVFIVKKDPSLTEGEVKEFCREQLTGYKRPRFIEFRDSLPKSNVGKILRKDLRQP